jgi:hypothetical protein
VEPDAVDLATLKRLRAELPIVYKRVLARAAMIVAAKRWTGNRAVLPEGTEAADLAHEAVRLVLAGRRRWDREKVPDLFVFLGNVMRSLASHLVTGGSSREAGDVEALDTKGMMADQRPESDPEVGRRCDDLVNEAFAAAGDDPVCSQIVDACVAGCVKADEIAEEAKLERAVVYEGIRRLQRRIKGAAKRRKS